MKAWQIFALGLLGLVLLFFWTLYEAFIAAVAALIVVAVVAFGFLLRPRKDVFYIPTTIYLDDEDDFKVEHGHIAMRVELARLWLLFVPTFSALAFLVLTTTKGTIWNFPLLDSFWENGSAFLVVSRYFLLAVFFLLSTWVSERWVLRDADACNTGSVSGWTGQVSYSFVDRSNEYYGGVGLSFGLVRDPELATIVLYSIRNPAHNKIAMCCLFHRFIVIGRGITDLDEATVGSHFAQMQPSTNQ
ncbi:MAG: hypothetical protein AB7O65_14485 [Candidatus Korobacteraceae bacterium]